VGALIWKSLRNHIQTIAFKVDPREGGCHAPVALPLYNQPVQSLPPLENLQRGQSAQARITASIHISGG